MNGLNEEFRTICGTWEHAGLDSRENKIKALFRIVEQLDDHGSVAARDLSHRAANLAAEIDRAVEREREQARKLHLRG